MMRSLFMCLTTLAVGLLPQVTAAERRALLVGINSYRPSAIGGSGSTEGATATAPVAGSNFPRKTTRKTWTDLKGAVNDVLVMREILVSRFGFTRANIVELTNQEATRDRILLELRRHLKDSIQPGNVCVFYFAGHGSQVRNTRSDEADGLDETIVPADAHSGAPDIRDKELRWIFNEIIDRGGVLTCFFDSCKSGSASRGLVVSTS